MHAINPLIEPHMKQYSTVNHDSSPRSMQRKRSNGARNPASKSVNKDSRSYKLYMRRNVYSSLAGPTLQSQQAVQTYQQSQLTHKKKQVSKQSKANQQLLESLDKDQIGLTKTSEKRSTSQMAENSQKRAISKNKMQHSQHFQHTMQNAIVSYENYTN